MLDIIRKNASSWMIKFILGAIIIVFAFWGIGSFRSDRASAVATVNGEKILLEDYKWAYSSTMDRYQQMFGGRIPEGFMDKFNFSQIVLDSLINDLLIRQGATANGIMVTDKEVRESILVVPAFQVDGIFNQMLYERALRTARLTPAAFEDQMRQYILVDKVRAILNAGIFVPEDEVISYFLYKNLEMDLEYVKLNAKDHEKDVQVDDKEIQAWYEKNKDKYLTLSLFKFRYLAFIRPEYEKKIEIKAKDIKDYYDKQKEEFTDPEKRSARHILLKVPEDADAIETEKIKIKAFSIYEKAKGGHDFAKLAERYSEDITTAEKGGYLGFFPRGIMDKPFEDTVFSLKKGKISKPIKSRYGFHIIKLEEISPGSVKALEEVKPKISEKLKRQQAERLVWEKANNAYDEILQMGGLDEYAHRTGAVVKETAFFDKQSPPEIIKGKNESLNSILSLKKGELGSLIQINEGVIIPEMVDIKAPQAKPLKEVRDQIIKGLKDQKTKTICREKAEKLLKIAKEKGLSEAAREFNLEVEDTGFFKKTEALVSRKLPAPAIQAGLSLNKENEVHDSVVEMGNIFFVLSLKGQKEGDMADFADQKKKIKEQLFQEKQLEVFKEWVDHLRKKAKIEQLMDV